MEDMREKTAELEREERTVRNIESAMRTIRLRGDVQVDGEKEVASRKWWMTFRSDARDTQPTTLTPAESQSVYEALQIVKSRHVNLAIALAKELGTEAKV